LPRDAKEPPPLGQATPQQLQEYLSQSKRIVIDRMDCEHFTRLEDWWADVKDKYEGPGAAAGPAAAPPAGAMPPGGALPGAGPPGEAAAGGGPTGEGWVIQLKGHHYHNQDPGNEGAEYIRRTLLRNLMEQTIPLADKDGQVYQFSPKEVGIIYPLLCSFVKATPEDVPLPGANPGKEQPGAPAGGNGPPVAVTVLRTDFTLQFVWKETPMDKRIEAVEKQRKSQAEKATVPGAPGAAIAPGAPATPAAPVVPAGTPIPTAAH